MNRRLLSSAQTVWMKFIFPAIWISGFGLGTLGLFLGVFHGKGDSPPPEWMKWQFLAVWLLGSSFVLWGNASLKRIYIDDVALYVSNYIREIRIPLDAISKITENRWINTHPITIYFRYSTGFGDRVVFIPPMRFFPWSSHPVVSELRSLCAANSTSQNRQ